MEPEEAERIRLHLAECPRCSEEVAQHHQVAALLGNAGGEAPAHLWNEIAGRIEELPRSAEPRRVLTSVPTSSGARRRHPAGVRVAARRAAVLGIAAAAVVVALLSLQVVHLNDRVGSLDALNSAHGLNHLVAAAFADPHAQKVSLESASTGTTAAEVAILPSGTAYLVNKELPALPSDQTYQLWGRSDNQLISIGVLGNRPSMVAFSVGSGVGYSTYVVTAERAGGVVVTKHRPVAMSSIVSA
jgi:negative regulator of sigma E activity